MSEAVQITFSICATIIICILIVSINFRNSFEKDKPKQKEHVNIKICIPPIYPRPPKLGTGAIISSEKSEEDIKVSNERSEIKEVNGMEIVLQSTFIKGYSKEPLKKHKNRRIQKKWNKKYGFKPIPDPQIYFINNKIMGHPETIRKMLKAIPDL